MNIAPPQGLPFGGFSCNCALSIEMQQWFLDAEARTRIVRTAEIALDRVIDRADVRTMNGAFAAAWITALQLLALAYQHRDGYQEVWRPEGEIIAAADSE